MRNTGWQCRMTMVSYCYGSISYQLMLCNVGFCSHTESGAGGGGWRLGGQTTICLPVGQWTGLIKPEILAAPVGLILAVPAGLSKDHPQSCFTWIFCPLLSTLIPDPANTVSSNVRTALTRRWTNVTDANSIHAEWMYNSSMEYVNIVIDG